MRRYAGAGYPGNDNPPPVTPDLEATIDWDGLDADGDPVPIAKAHLTLFYYYAASTRVADPDATFAAYDKAGADGVPRAHRRRRRPATGFAVAVDRVIGTVGRAQTGLGGWDLDVHHVYDALSGNVLLGDGTVRGKGEIPGGRLRTVVPFTPGGGPGAEQRRLRRHGRRIGRLRGRARRPADLPGRRRRRHPDRGHCQFATPSSRSSATAAPPWRATSGTSRTSPRGRTAACSWPSAQFFGSEDQGARICEITADGRLVKVAGAATNACPAGVDDCRGDGDPAVGRADRPARPPRAGGRRLAVLRRGPRRRPTGSTA